MTLPTQPSTSKTVAGGVDRTPVKESALQVAIEESLQEPDLDKEIPGIIKFILRAKK